MISTSPGSASSIRLTAASKSSADSTGRPAVMASATVFRWPRRVETPGSWSSILRSGSIWVFTMTSRNPRSPASANAGWYLSTLASTAWSAVGSPLGMFTILRSRMFSSCVCSSWARADPLTWAISFCTWASTRTATPSRER